MGRIQNIALHYCGILALIIANFILPDAMPGSGFLLYGSSFFAFATLFPRIEFLMFFILPVQVRFLAWFRRGDAVGSVRQPAVGSVFPAGLCQLSLLGWNPSAARDRSGHRIRATEETFQRGERPEEAFHTCMTCLRSDVTDPGLEFRVGRDGREYCADHLP